MGVPNISKLQERSQPTTELEDVNFCNEEEEKRMEEKQVDLKEGRRILGDNNDEVQVSCLKIKSMVSFEEGKEVDDGCTTPRSKDHKIEVIFPPTPKKSKTLPSTKTKRGGNKRVLFLDCSKEIEALFSPSSLTDLGGNKIKKARASLA